MGKGTKSEMNMTCVVVCERDQIDGNKMHVFDEWGIKREGEQRSDFKGLKCWVRNLDFILQMRNHISICPNSSHDP